MSDALPEPRDVGPIAGGNMRVADRDRDLVTQVLTTAYAEGRLTRDELDERVQAAVEAKTFDDLTPLTRDLVPLGPAAATAVSPARAAGSALVDRSTVQQEPERLVAIFGGAERKGHVRIRRETQYMALFGGVDLDWREAKFEAEEVVLQGGLMFGGLDIKLPEGVHVRDETIAIFGGTDVKYTAEPGPGVPTMVLKGFCLFGGISVRGPKPSKAARASRK